MRLVGSCVERLGRAARRSTLPPRCPAPGPEVDDVVGGADRLLVVLDDEHAVAEIAQAPQRLDEAHVVALVQADARLVEHVHHARELAAELAREADALRLAAAQRRARRGRASGSRARRRGGSEGGRRSRAARPRRWPAPTPASDEAARSAPSASATVIAVTSAMLLPADAHRERSPARRRLPPHASHGRSRMKLPVLLARRLGRRLAEAPLEVGIDALELHRPRAAGLSVPSLPQRTAMLLALRRRRAPCCCFALRRACFHGVSRSTSKALARRRRRCAPSSPRRAPSPSPRGRWRRRGSTCDGSGTTSSGSTSSRVAEAVARRAHAERRVEGEALRRELREATPQQARAALNDERSPPALAVDDAHLALALARARARRPRRCAPRSLGAHDDAIDHELDRVLLLLVERRARRRARTSRRRPRRARSRAPCSSSKSSRNSPLRCTTSGARSVSFVPSGSARSSRAICLRRPARRPSRRSVAALLAGPRVEDAQVVVDLGDRADGRARVRRRALLLDGDGRREAAQVLDLAAARAGPRNCRAYADSVST